MCPCLLPLPLWWPQGRGGEGLEASLHHILATKCGYSESEQAGLVALQEFTVGLQVACGLGCGGWVG